MPKIRRSTAPKTLPSSGRRRLLLQGLAAAAGSVITGCCRIRSAPMPSCAIAPTLPDPRPLAIDVHTHIFNGSDLQVGKFIALNTSISFAPELKALAGEILQALTWTFAPSGCDEYALLGTLANCSASTRDTVVAKHNAEAYQQAKKEILATPPMRGQNTAAAKTRRSRGLIAPDARTRYIETIAALLDAPDHTSFAGKTAALHANALHTTSIEALDSSKASLNVAGLLRFIFQGFKYRFVNVEDYLATYNTASGGRSLDLVIANMVDYDWPEAMGNKTRTPLPDQLMVMERLSLHTYGRVHAFVPFDPMRQVALLAGHRAGATLTMKDIQDAVMNRGFLGVKMYPPMGFLPMNNAAQPKTLWAQTWLPAWMKDDVPYPDGSTKSFGARLDDVLATFFAWAETNEVPITIHAEASQGPSASFDAFGSSQQWQSLLSAHPNLRLNFGHTGSIAAGLNTGTVYPHETESLLGYMGAPGSGGPLHAYGDLSYAPRAVGNLDNFKQLLLGLIDTPALPGGAALADRLLYGTDWLMLLQEPECDEYFATFQSVFASLEAHTPGLSDRIFAVNALNWAGLRPGGRAWDRLLAFYKANGIDTDLHPPPWMKKAAAFPAA